MIKADDTPENLIELESYLQSLSHDLQPLSIIQSFARKIGKTKARQKLFNANGALVRPPIEYQAIRERGLISPQEDSFTLLQGDIISSRGSSSNRAENPVKRNYLVYQLNILRIRPLKLLKTRREFPYQIK